MDALGSEYDPNKHSDVNLLNWCTEEPGTGINEGAKESHVCNVGPEECYRGPYSGPGGGVKGSYYSDPTPLSGAPVSDDELAPDGWPAPQVSKRWRRHWFYCE